VDDKKIWGASSTLSKCTRSTKGYVQEVRRCLVAVINKAAKPGERHPFHGWTYTKGEGMVTSVSYKTFDEYLAKWCQFTSQELKDLFSRDAEISDLLDIACQRKPGKTWDTRGENNTFDNIQDNPAPTGTSKNATLRRLRKDNPELHDKVVAGELSANAAAIEAGFRYRSISISERCAKAAAKSILSKFGDEFAKELKDAL
jgi:hypothetical protein